jgi:KDO2-lipid IV(A) lauroyltransferase
MGKLNSLQGSIAALILKGFSACVCILPLRAALFIGRRIGDIAYFIGARPRQLAMSHLKVAFGKTRSYAELKIILRDFYHAYGQSIVEIGRLPLIARQGYEGVVDVRGREAVDEAMKKGRGCIFLSIHSGNWELSNIVGSMIGYPYNMVANDLNHINKVAEFLNDLRRSAGCHIINPGIGGREIIRSLKKNKIVTLVADQGGADGFFVPFLGRQASMSTGAVRIALKYDVPIMLVDIHRTGPGRHLLSAEPFVLTNTGDIEKDLVENLPRMMRQYEQAVARHPAEYVWFYKTWKYAKDRVVLVLDDGRVGHLRQSQAVARAYVTTAKEKDLTVTVETIVVKFRDQMSSMILPIFSGGIWIGGDADMSRLRYYLKPESFAALQRLRPDVVISCGARNAAVNSWVARNNRARSIAVLPNKLLAFKQFDLVVVHQHDLMGKKAPANAVVTKAAPNLIDKAYLDENVKALVGRYQHLRNNVRTKMAVLIGGHAQGVVMSEQDMKIVLHQLKEVADAQGIDLLITTSRRTPPAIEQLVIREFKDHPRTALLIIANKVNVPEAVGGVLALADIVVVSGESISMVSEAASSGKRTVVFAVGTTKNQKYAEFCQMLAHQSHILYTGPKGVSSAIDSAVRNKIMTKPINDNAVLLDALRKITR